MDIEASSYLSPSALKIRLRWDVFLSFRGEDTRHIFTGQLYAALQDVGVRAFIDNEGLIRGDEISPSLIEAIEDSAAAVAIISPRYADSRWCLEELSRIFELRRLVLPVFYRVDPSDVRRQKGPFEEGLRTLEQRFDGSDVMRWRNALDRVGNISGFVFVESEESQLIQSIVKRVLAELNNTPVHVASYAIGLDSRVETVLRRLDIHSNRIQVLGIHGTPGIGKTTLAKAVFNKLIVHFELRCFILNVKETLAKEGLLGLQRQILSHLLGSSVTSENDTQLAIQFRRIVHESRILVVLDDIADGELFSSLGIERRRMDEGSRIIVTSRDREVLLNFTNKNELYEANKLDSSESLELFSYHSLRRKQPTEEFFNLAVQIVSLTGGLPLALEVFGSFLLDKRTKREWEESLQKLQQIRPSGIQNVLKISFDGLDDEEQCIFLDISCLLIQMNMKTEYAVDVFEGCGFPAKVAIKRLITKSLLKVTEDDTLWMHDQLRDMGRQIVIQENINDPGARSRLWDPKSIMSMLKNKQGTRHVRGFVLDSENKELVKDMTAETISRNNFRRKPNIITSMIYLREKLKSFRRGTRKDDNMILSTQSFEPMVMLKLLQLNYAKVKGDFKYMPSELRWLEWKGCPLKSLPSNIPREISVLNLSESKIKHLWGWRWWPSDSKSVVENLTVINLHGCHNLTAIPDLSGHRNLKKLILERCTRLTKIHKSIGNVSSLIHLNLTGCSNLEEFPADVSGLRRLKEFILSGCSKLNSLPDDVRSLKSLVKLLVDDTAISKLPEYLFHLTKLEVLSLKGCKLLKYLPRCIGNLGSLKELSLDGSALEELPDSIGSLTCIEKLGLRHCISLTSIPDTVGNLKTLAELYLTGSSINQLPGSVCSLPYLKILSLANCRSLLTLPTQIGALASIVELDLDKIPMSELPEQIGLLKVIKKLEMRNCTSLKSLPESIGSMLTLSKLIIVGAAITELPESIGMLENLNFLNLNRCTQLCKLPDSIGRLTSLHHLLMGETAVAKLPESIGMLSNLRTLTMAKKPHLESTRMNAITCSHEQPNFVVLPASFSSLSLLEEFNARAWKVSGQIPDDFEKLSSLTILNLGYNSFHSLPSSLQGLSVLQQLFLPCCTKLESLPPLPSSLLEINAADCSALTSISDLSNLEKLQELRLANCSKLVDVPGLQCLKSLRRLYMGGCNSSASAVKKKLRKVALKKLNYLSVPGSRIPGWFSQEAITYRAHVNLAIEGVIIGLVVSVDRQLLDDVRAQLPAIIDIQAKILRLDLPIFTTAMYLMGIPNTSNDQTYLCRFRKYNPLVSMLKEGDKLQVTMRNEDIMGIKLKSYGIFLIYENDDDYDGEEDLLDESQLSVSEKLARFFCNLDTEE